MIASFYADSEVDVERCDDSPRAALSNLGEPEIPSVRIITTPSGSYKSILQQNTTSLPVSSSMKAHLAAMHNYSSMAPSNERSTSGRNGYTVRDHRYVVKRSRSDVAPPHSALSQPGFARRQKSTPEYVRAHYGPNSRLRPSTMRDIYARKFAHPTSGRRTKAAAARSVVDYDDLSPDSKRAYHNSLERRRRDDQRMLQMQLREAIPTLHGRDKVCKLECLREARSYILRVQNSVARAEQECSKYRQKNEELRRKRDQLLKFKVNNRL